MKALIVIRKVNEILFYPTKDWELSTFHIIKVTKAGKVSCNCTQFKASFGKSSCPHTKVIAPHVKKGIFAWQGIMKSADTILLKDKDVQTMEHDVGVYLEGVYNPAIIQPLDRAVDMHQVINQLKLFDAEGKLTDFNLLSASTLNTKSTSPYGVAGLNKIKEQLTRAVATNQSINSVDVTDLDPEIINRPFDDVDEDEEDEQGTSGHPWLDIPRPSNFYVSKDDWTKLLWGVCQGKSILLTGPTGSGKTELAIKAAEALGFDHSEFNFGAMTEARTALLGMTNLTDKGTQFKESRFVRAIDASVLDEDNDQQYRAVILDEITRAPKDAFNILLPLMDRQGVLYLDEKECDDPKDQIVDKSVNVAFIATANIGVEYTGTGAMDRAVFDRFPVKIECGYPPRKAEIKILKHRAPECDSAFIHKICTVSEKQRNLYQEEEMDDAISTRMMIECAEMVGDDVPWNIAIEATMLSGFNHEGGADSDRNKLLLILQNENLI